MESQSFGMQYRNAMPVDLKQCSEVSPTNNCILQSRITFGEQAIEIDLFIVK